MKNTLLCVLFVLLVNLLFGQNTPPPHYYDLVRNADSLFKLKDYKKAAVSYHAAFATFGGNAYIDHRYNAACSWAYAGYADSAFYNLQRIIAKANYSDLDQISTEPGFVSLRNDKRWLPLLGQVMSNIERIEAKYDKPAIKLLDSLVKLDQKWRNMIRDFDNKELRNDTISKETIIKNMIITDSLNLFHVKIIFRKYGFPGYDILGQEGSRNFWLIVQHQDKIPAFQDSVLQLMKIQVDVGNASLIDYAYLLDRVKVNVGKPQIYGTQMTLNQDGTSYVPKSVVEPEKLNERRKSVGLEPIEKYIESMNKRYFGSLKQE